MPTVNCPVCEGEGKYHYEDIYGRHQMGRCTACKGSCTLELSQQAYDRRERELTAWEEKAPKKYDRSWLGEELQLALSARSHIAAYKAIIAAGYRRTYNAVGYIRRKAQDYPDLVLPKLLDKR